MTTNQQIHLVSRPTGEASLDNFKLVEATVPDLKDGQVLVKHHFMSLDPYMRGRMNDAKSYAVPQPLNAVMQGGTVGEVVVSKNAAYAVGDKVVGFGGWQQFSVVDAGTPGVLRKVDTTHVPLSAYLGAVGMLASLSCVVNLWKCRRRRPAGSADWTSGRRWAGA